eukprot:15288983-Ditylum_brightwellii.AAC.1
MGGNTLNDWPKTAALICDMDPDGFTSMCWRRSGATELANGGAGLINLKCAGGWKSSTVAEGYIAQ